MIAAQKAPLRSPPVSPPQTTINSGCYIHAVRELYVLAKSSSSVRVRRNKAPSCTWRLIQGPGLLNETTPILLHSLAHKKIGSLSFRFKYHSGQGPTRFWVIEPTIVHLPPMRRTPLHSAVNTMDLFSKNSRGYFCLYRDIWSWGRQAVWSLAV